MSGRMLALGIVALLAGHAGAQSIDRAKVRELIELPQTELFCGVGVNAEGNIMFDSEVKNKSGRIAVIEKALTGDASDGERYRQLSNLYPNKQKATAAAAKAVEIGQAELQRNPKDARLTMQLGRALWTAQRPAEAEKYLRQALALAPSDSDCWLALGDCLLRRSIRVLAGTPDKAVDFSSLFAITPKQLDAENIKASRALVDQAGQCFERAISAAPKQAKCYHARVGFRTDSTVVRGLQAGVFGNRLMKRMMESLYSAESVRDMRTAADVSPDDPRAQTAAAMWAMIIAAKPGSDTLPASYSADFAKNAASLNQRLSRLQTHADKSIAAEACFGEGLIRMIALESLDKSQVERARAQVEKLLRRALSLNPRHDPSWELLVLATKDNPNALVTACEDRLKTADSARNRFLAAKAQMYLDHSAEAERHLRSGLRADPKDVLSHLGLAALLLKRGDNAGMAEAERLLNEAVALLRDKKDARKSKEAATLRAFQAALTGDLVAARRYLPAAKNEDKDSPAANLRRMIGN